MISKGCLQPLLILLSTQDLVVRQQSAAAVRDLASNLTYKATMAEEGFRYIITRCHNIVLKLVWILYPLLLGCLQRSIELGKDEDMQLKTIGMGIIRHLSINTRVKRPIVTMGGESYIALKFQASSLLFAYSHLLCSM